MIELWNCLVFGREREDCGNDGKSKKGTISEVARNSTGQDGCGILS